MVYDGKKKLKKISMFLLPGKKIHIYIYTPGIYVNACSSITAVKKSKFTLVKAV